MINRDFRDYWATLTYHKCSGNLLVKKIVVWIFVMNEFRYKKCV